MRRLMMGEPSLRQRNATTRYSVWGPGSKRAPVFGWYGSVPTSGVWKVWIFLRPRLQDSGSLWEQSWTSRLCTGLMVQPM
jgi:hypothetical protein